MMRKDFKAYAAKCLSEIFQDEDYPRVLSLLQETDPDMGEIKPEVFGMEFLSARLALASHAWVRSCRENKVEDRDAENLFFKAVMASFQSSKFVDIAAAYSEYLHAPMAEDKPVLAVSAMMIRRLGLSGSLGSPESPLLPGVLQTLVGVCESFKNLFENQFFEFFHSS